MMRLIFFSIIVFLVGCSSEKIQWAKVERKCSLSSEQKEVAWQNIVAHVSSRYPEHSNFCELDKPAEKQEFNVVNGECRIQLGCSKNVNGEFLTHGDLLVVINEFNQSVINAYGVKW